MMETTVKLFISSILVLRLAIRCSSLTLSNNSNSTNSARIRNLKRSWNFHHKGQTKSKSFSYLDLQSQFIALHSLAYHYSNFATLESAQEKYDLPSVGSADDCAFMRDPEIRKMLKNNYYNASRIRSLDEMVGCQTYILTIYDKIAHPLNSQSYKNLPQLLLNGALHGTETVGPTTLIELSSLLLEVAHCEALPFGIPPDETSNAEQWDEWDEQLNNARSCRRQLALRGITKFERTWIARLVTTRRIVIIPTVNTLGSFQELDLEEGVDPDYDFLFDVKDATKCLRTMTARILNQVIKEHMFQLMITFHSGKSEQQNSVAFNWASPSYAGTLPPDYEVMDQIAQGFSMYGGLFDWHKELYPTGPISEEIEAYRGSLEDWAYASSFIDQRVKCTAKTNGGLTNADTTYTQSQLRVIPMLVDAARSKNPPEAHLGNSFDLFNPDSKGNGHVPRNLRLSLMAIDIVQPYVLINSVDGIPLQDDIVPMSTRGDRNCMRTKSMSVPHGTEFIMVEWEVGGGLSVDSTSIFFSKWSDLPNEFDGASQPPNSLVSKYYKEFDEDDGVFDGVRITPVGKGRTRWYKKDLNNAGVFGPLFSAYIDISDFEQGDEIAVYAVAQVDGSWGKTSSDVNVSPKRPPQSHLVNARLNPDWHHVNDDFEINGRLKWFSIPVTIVITSGQSLTSESSIRLYSGESFEEEEEILLESILSILMAFFLICGGFYCYKIKRKRSYEPRNYGITEMEALDGYEMTFPNYPD